MEDTVGMASTLTGGYGNSYAQTAGQQTYNAYLQQLSSLMPELYGAAYDRYRAEGEALYNEIVLTEQRRENAYNKLVSLMSLGYDPTDEELTAAGLTRPQANTLRSHYNPTYTGYDNRNTENETEEEVIYTYEDVKAYLDAVDRSTEALMTQKDWVREKRLAGKNIAGTRFDYPSYQDYLRACAEGLG